MTPDDYDAGYPRLAELPDRLAEVIDGGHTRLFHLFQAQSSTKALYRLVAIVIGRGWLPGKVVRGAVAALRALRPLPGLFGIVVASPRSWR